MIELEEAQRNILEHVVPLAAELCPIQQAVGRFLATQLVSAQDLPPFDNSAMDGYAVRAEDLQDVDEEQPASLHLIGQVAAGETFDRKLRRNECVRIFTGSPLPPGADAIIMQEDTRADPSRPDWPLMLAKVTPWENVRFRGEDLKCGSVLLEPGEALTPSRVGLVAAIGCREVTVHRRPIVGLVATGSELREAGESLAPGQIYESNRVTLASLAAQAGALPRIYPLVADTLAATQSALTLAFEECDAVLTSGGVSVGELDCVKAAFLALGGELAFWRVAIKPGKPFALGKCQGKLLFALPGNPVSAFVTFLLLVRPALLAMQGATDTRLPRSPGVLAEQLGNPGNRRHFVRVVLTSDGQVRASGNQASHLLHSLARANGLVDVPPNCHFAPGTNVQVLRWS